jgi:hypothetical protein
MFVEVYYLSYSLVWSTTDNIMFLKLYFMQSQLMVSPGYLYTAVTLLRC